MGAVGPTGPSGQTRLTGEYFCPVCLNKMETSSPFSDLQYHCNSCRNQYDAVGKPTSMFGKELLNYEEVVNEKRFRILNEIICQL